MDYSTILGCITFVYCSALAAFFCWRLEQTKDPLEKVALLISEVVCLGLGVFVICVMGADALK